MAPPPRPSPRTPRGPLALSLLLVTLCLASCLVPRASAQTCATVGNKVVYKNDDQCKSAGFSRTCDVPEKWCNCTSKAWKVGPFYVNTTSSAMSQNYLNVNQGQATGNTKPYIHSVVGRTQCCALCNQNGNMVRLSNGSWASYVPAAGTNTSAWLYQPSNVKPPQYCAFWQHYVPTPAATALTGSGCTTQTTGTATPSPDACGYCIIYPSPTVTPACTSAPDCTDSTYGDFKAGQYSTVGKGCPGGKNDPHFVGAEGTHFDFNGVPEESFCLVTDERFHVNMLMRGYLDKRTVGASVMRDGMAVRTWIKELGVMWMDKDDVKHTLRIWARDGKSQVRDAGFVGGYELDGAAIPLMTAGGTYDLNDVVTLEFVGFEKQGGGFFDVDSYMLTVPGVVTIEIKARVAHPLLQTQHDAMSHLNVRFFQFANTPNIHGVLGQTFRAGRERRALEYSALSQLLHRDIPADGEAAPGYLDGRTGDYKTSSVTATDCKYTAFGGKLLPL